MQKNAYQHYMPQLDGLRFIAFLMVFFSHLPHHADSIFLRNLKFFGGLGVDFFFVIGAFLFTKLLYSEWQNTGHIKIAHFYLRRILRIVPLYYVYLSAILILYGRNVVWNHNNILHGIGLVTFTDNLLFAWLSIDWLPCVTHLWTISWEIQLYLVLPLLFYCLVHLSPRQRLIVCAISLGIAMVLRYPVLNMNYNNIFMFLVRRPDSVLIGMLLAFATESPKSFSRYEVWTAWLVWVSAVLMSIFIIAQGPIAQFGDKRMLYLTPVFAVTFGGILIAAIRPNSLFGHLLSCLLLRYLGKISYGLYVYHIVCNIVSLFIINFLEWSDTAFNDAGQLVFALSLALTIIMGSFSYYLFERPFLKIKERYAIVQSRPA